MIKIGNLECYGVIYKITNNINGKTYIGKTKNGFKIRYGNNLINNMHNKELKNDLIIFGLENFNIREIIDVAFSHKELCIKEHIWIGIYKYNTYNIDLYDAEKQTKLFYRIKIEKQYKDEILELITSKGYYALCEK